MIKLTKEEIISFLETALRNWSYVPRLSGDDIEDVVIALEELIEKKVEKLEQGRDQLRKAIKPFADCCDHILYDESDEEWAKFRLLVSDYRRAYKAFSETGDLDGNAS